MAIDNSSKALNIGSEMVDAVEQMMTAIEKLQSLEEQRAASGLVMTDYNTDFANSAIKHVDGDAINAVINVSIPAIWTFMTTNNHDDNLQKVRP